MDDDEQSYSFVFTGDVRYRTADLNTELPEMKEEEWNRVDSLLAETPMRIVQEMHAEFTTANHSFRMLCRRRSEPQEIQANVEAYLRSCLGRDGGNPIVSTNTQMVTQ